MRRTRFKKKILLPLLPMCSSTWFLWFFLSLDLSTAPLVTREKRGKNSTRVWRDGRSLSLIRVQPLFSLVSPTKSTPKRSHWEEIDLVLDGTNEESSLTRASSALHSRTPIRSCESARFPSVLCFVYRSLWGSSAVKISLWIHYLNPKP